MKRRTFLKDICAAGLYAALPVTAIGSLTSCASQATDSHGFNFDEEVDRLGTHSIKMARGEEMGGNRLGMGIADMDFRMDPAISQALHERINRDVIGYTRTPDAYFDAIMQWQKKVHQWDVPKDWITAIPGVVTSINLVYDVFTQPGDKVIIQPPVYDPFKEYILDMGRVPVDNPLIYTDGTFHMDLANLEKVMHDEQPKAMVLCNPHNPGGMCWTRAELEKVAELAKTYGVLVISDEVHGDLAWYDEHPFIPFLSTSDAAREVGITVTGPTKTFNLAGFTGTAYGIIANSALKEPFVNFLKCHKLLEASVPTEICIMSAYTSTTGWYDAMMDYMRGNVEFVMDYFAKEIPQIKPVRPHASFLFFLDCRALNLDADGLKTLFDEKAGLVVSNGINYGPGGEGFIRLNVGCTRRKLKQALEQLKGAIG